jgi:DNA polymerase-3 subunit gamma/tau
LFSEEDLARHLQIMLRTHAELGYRQEQRFHLELGLLKLAHAQRLLPIEQLLSGAEIQNPPTERKLTIAPEPKKAEQIAQPRPFVSPFAADSARKGTPRSEASAESTAPRVAPAAISSAPVVMGSAAPAVAVQTAREPEPQLPVDIVSPPSANIDDVRSGVLNALGSSGQTMLCSMLEAGEWSTAGNELIIRLAASATLIEMSVSANAKKMIIASASGVMGRAVKLQILPGATAQTGPSKTQVSYSNGSSRSRAEQEPVVQRLKEKFGAQIRTVIDYKGKR